MATYEQLSSALVKADAAGNVDDARALASELRRLKTTAPATGEGMPGERQRSWADVPFEAISNVIPSGVKMAGGVYEAVTSPIQTAKGLIDVGAGALQNVLPKGVVDFVNQFDKNPEARQRAIAAADAVGGMYKERYGSEESLKKTMATDPVGFAADLSTLLSGGAAAAGKLGMAKTAGGLTAAADITNPMRAITPVVAAPIKVAGKGIKYAEQVLNPKANALLQAAEGRGPEIVNALRAQQELVPGALPTAGEIAAGQGSTLYPALQTRVMEKLPTEYLQRAAQKAEAIKGQLGAVAQTPEAVAAAEKLRTQVTKPMYTAAEQAGNVVNTAPIKAFVDDIIEKKPGNTELVTEFKKLSSQLVDEAGTPRANAEQVASILDGLKATLAKKENAYIKGQLMEVKDKLTKAIPGYEKAQEAFGELSQPINQMAVGQYLQNQLVPALGGEAKLKSSAFAQAVQDAPKTIERATGIPRYQTLAEVLAPDQLKAVEGIGKELQRQVKFEEAAAAGRKAGMELPTTKVSKINLLNKVTTVANLIMAKLQGHITEKLAIELATEMLDPKKAADSLQKAIAHQKKMQALGLPVKELGEVAKGVTSGQPAIAAGQLTNALATQPQQNQNALAR